LPGFPPPPDLPRRAIQVAAFAVVVIGVVSLALGDSWGLMIFSTGCYFVAHPFDGHPMADVLVELVRRRWGGPTP
jgi:hypothetical protein